MAAARSALARISLSRRSCVSSGGSSAAAPMAMGGRVLEIPQIIRPASSIRPATVFFGNNLQNWQRFSTEGREWADPKKLPLMKEKARHVLRRLGKW
ncbi:hypothetical protein U9M48_021094 [Paspalum notatum var. saurae]|uniref:Uncharacterized protein n=1 Tax=Paspalum notatum var. saurae TaxID=547442 RepID=A0AAQ3TET2_PASNO